ncbi:sialidase family protein [Actinoallomurus sp. NPDC052274]|uniref:sialidase family protein n=1 Tax=Actinoallomurus sp. NPDC052274 TaxID=3155420 RepID=UPI0034147C70
MTAAVTLTASALATVSPTPALAAVRPALVAAGDPFAGCAADAGGGDTFAAGSQAEPWIAVDPADERHWVVAWQQDRWGYGSARGAVTAVTRDGGRTWRRVVLPVTLCAGGRYGRITNVWLAFAPGGRLYATLVAAGVSPLSTGIAVLTSADGGDTWSGPTQIVSDPMSDYFNDKPALTVDPSDPRRVYLVWNRRHQADDRHSLLYSRSTDAGRTWEPARSIYQPSQGRGTIGNQIVVLPDGTLLNVFHEAPFAIGGASAAPSGVAGAAPAAATGDQIQVIRSADHGATWSAPTTIAEPRLATPVLPGTTTPIVGGSIVPDVTVDRRGRVYVVWADGSLSGSGSAIALTVSADGGHSWTRPVKINHTPDSAAGGTGQAFLPQVDAAPDGSLAVGYYDLRDDTTDPAVAADHWIARCHGDRCAAGAAGWQERRTGGPFDLGTAIRWFDGPFLGTYTGLAHTRHRFVAAFVMTGGAAGDPQDVYVTSVPFCSARSCA